MRLEFKLIVFIPRVVISQADLSISIVIPVYNGGNAFRQCLFSVKQFAPKNTEIIVVADGDTDGSGDFAETAGAIVIRTPRAGGPARARNLGARVAHGEILLFLDADVTIAAETIPQVSQVFAQNPGLAALIGSYDDMPGAANFLSQYKNLFHHYTHQRGNAEASTFWGACGAIRRDIFLSINGFDERYRLPCIEDIELGYRLKQAGYQIRLCKTIQIKHLKRWGIISLLRADFFYRAIPWTSLLLSYRSFVNDLNLDWSNRISVILVYGLLGTLLTAYWWLPALFAACIIGSALLVINAPVYRFFRDKRGFLFAIQTIPWHWFYYFYGGLAFVLGSILHFLRPQNLPRSSWS